MQITSRQLEILNLQQHLQALTEQFDLAVKKDAELGELKKIYHEMKTTKNRLDQLNFSINQSDQVI